MNIMSIAANDPNGQILELVCAGLIRYERGDATFAPISYHHHPPEIDHSTATCPIRTYASSEAVDGRFAGMFLPNMQAVLAVNWRHVVRGQRWGVRVVMPILLARALFGFDNFDMPQVPGEAA